MTEHKLSKLQQITDTPSDFIYGSNDLPGIYSERQVVHKPESQPAVQPEANTGSHLFILVIGKDYKQVLRGGEIIWQKDNQK